MIAQQIRQNTGGCACLTSNLRVMTERAAESPFQPGAIVRLVKPWRCGDVSDEFLREQRPSHLSLQVGTMGTVLAGAWENGGEERKDTVVDDEDDDYHFREADTWYEGSPDRPLVKFDIASALADARSHADDLRWLAEQKSIMEGRILHCDPEVLEVVRLTDL